MDLFEEILKARGLTGKKRDAFLHPSYDSKHDPFLLPDMDRAVERLITAHKKQEKITIYGDYDIDGLTATTILLDAFESFGFNHVDAFIPNRFVEGYGLTVTEQVPIEVEPNPENERYLAAKREKLGHRLHHQDRRFEEDAE